MLLTNHTLTGIVLGLTLDNPVTALPAGVASHLALDMTPHFGFTPRRKRPNAAQREKQTTFREPAFILLGSVDFAVSWTLAIGACFLWPTRALSILAGVIGAQLPDLTYIPVIVFGRKLISRIPGYDAMLRFFIRIQWSETPPGLITEGIWATGMLLILWAWV